MSILTDEANAENQAAQGIPLDKADDAKAAEQSSGGSAAVAGSENTVSNDGRERRRSRWHSAAAAIKYLNGLPRKEFRDTDRTTNILLIASLVVLAALVFTPLDATRFPLAMACILLFGTTIVFFVANRFGIIGTLTPRQAVLVWDLLVGVSLLIVFSVMCIEGVVFMLRTSIECSLPF